MGKTPRVFDDQFKRMAIELSYAKGSVKAASDELDMDPSLLSKWRRDPRFNENHVHPLPSLSGPSGDPEGENRRLRKALREMTLERDILKKAVGIFSKGDRNDSGL